ncbi:PREDICTED: uncharacterized protein LOC104821174 [Tarenaya hassleriana]|uniref:uncharacterized protein LOC104821174 n=1 Tax=Tarenaya hassleriana TaxID=28532 RepID=UPI00053C5AB6|nr:PREDICTED: uncharacterized protein LOC104821174 [Tarenaya hassleriana]
MTDSPASNASVSSDPHVPPAPPVLPPMLYSLSDPYSSPLYLHAADSSNLQLVPEKLVGESNYSVWSRAILKALNAKNKMGFVLGSVSQPPADHPDANLWSRTNDMVCTWLTNAVSSEIASLIVYLDDAHLVWRSLENRFKQGNVSKVYNIQHQLDTLHQGSLDLNSYYTKLTSLWEELRNFEPFPVCTCGGCTCGGCTCGGCSCKLPEQWSLLFEKNNVVKFLMRLNDSYSAVRRQILMQEPLPNLTKAYNLISQEEQQRLSFGSSSEQAAFQISAPSFRPKPYFSSSNPNPRNTQPTNRSKLSNPNHDKPKPICTHCGMMGHTVARCYYIHGFPMGYKSAAPLLPTPRNLLPAGKGLSPTF